MIRFVTISIVLLSQLCLATMLSGQSSHKLLRDGNKFYKVDEYRLAEEKYRKSLEAEGEAKSAFNLGNALYRQERYEEAIEQYQKATAGADTDIEFDKAGAFHNLGNAYFQAQEFEEALKSYKQAVRINPEDESTKYNLMVTKEVMRQMQQQQQEQQQSGEGENSENQDQQENQDQNQENQNEQNEQENEGNTSQDSTQIQEGNGFDSTRLEKQTLDSLDAVKLLEIVEGEEQKVQEKLRKFNSDRKKQEKDW